MFALLLALSSPSAPSPSLEAATVRYLAVPSFTLEIPGAACDEGSEYILPDLLFHRADSDAKALLVQQSLTHFNIG